MCRNRRHQHKKVKNTAVAMFQTAGAKLAYEVEGPDSGPLFVQMHGLTSSAWREHRAGLDVTGQLDGFRVLRFDSRGHGSSTGRAVPEDYLWSQLAEDLLELLDAIAPGEQVHTGGPSMGAATQICAALKDPQRFASLSLLVPLLWQPLFQLAPWLGGYVPSNLLITLSIVLLVVYLFMPLATRVFATWLSPRSEEELS